MKPEDQAREAVARELARRTEDAVLESDIEWLQRHRNEIVELIRGVVPRSRILEDLRLP